MFKFQLSDIKLCIKLFRLGLKDRILGSWLGVVWLFLNPILMLSIFTFVFGFVFKSKLPGSEKSLSYVIWLISGYGPWLAINEGITSGTTSITSNSSLIRNISFKTEILPISYALMGIIPLILSSFYLFILVIINTSFNFSGFIFFIPLIIIQFTFMSGLCLFLASLNVFIRDIALLLPNLLLIILFVSPIFYPLASFPSSLQALVKLNPFYLIPEGYRQIILYGSFLNYWQFFYLLILSFLTFYLGLGFFRKLKSYFDSRL
jgi:homopolymeric O-antigen transport system permease protein